jgi:hypothetical protein
MKSLSWFLSAALLASTALRPAVRADIVIGDRGTAVSGTGEVAAPEQAITDSGAEVQAYQAPAEEENKWLPWVLGGAAALVALVAGVLIADAGDSESGQAEAAAGQAAAGAAAAQAAAAAATAQQAAADQAAVDAQIANAQGAAAAIAAANPGPKVKMFVSGTWTGPTISVDCGMGPVPFTPSITFSSDRFATPGGVSQYQTKCSGVLPGGIWTAIENTDKINITVDEPFYTGRATVHAPNRMVLANGAVLTASGGGFAVLLSEDP